MNDPDAAPLPAKLDQIVRLFASSPNPVKLQALLDYSERLPPLPEHIDTSEMERVPECQTAFFLKARVAADGTVEIFFDAPREAPTTRGFAGIVAAGLEGATAQEIVALPDDLSRRLGLAEAVSPLRMRGMDAILYRLKRQLREQISA
jgi:cysteine desulfuration protein SufE